MYPTSCSRLRAGILNDIWSTDERNIWVENVNEVRCNLPQLGAVMAETW